MHPDHAIGSFLGQIQVYDVGLDKARFGRGQDGGYVLLPSLCPLAGTIYSFGVGDDVSFELDLMGRFPSMVARLYDSAIDEPPQAHERFIFHRRAAIPGSLPQFARDSILKMDIEWDEWDIFLGLPQKALVGFSQMAVEFHAFHVGQVEARTPYFRGLYGVVADKLNHHLFGIYDEVLDSINREFWCFHVHANNSLPLVGLGGFRFPPLLEMSFVRKDLVGAVRPYFGPAPVRGLDFPNKLDRSDIDLGKVMKSWRSHVLA